MTILLVSVGIVAVGAVVVLARRRRREPKVYAPPVLTLITNDEPLEALPPWPGDPGEPLSRRKRVRR